MLLWVGCIAGALEESENKSKLAAAGFSSITMEETRVYNIEDARAFLTGQGIDVDAIAPQVENKFMSAFVRATKGETSCCGPTCCN
jgi:arsenite methyltransferase